MFCTNAEPVEKEGKLQVSILNSMAGESWACTGWFWTIFEAFGRFWMLIDAFGQFQTSLEAFRRFWKLLETVGDWQLLQ